MSLRSLLLALAASLLTIVPAHAQAPDNITAGEIAMTPRYCHDVLDDRYVIGGPKTQYWVSRMGKGFLAVHHNCWGMLKTWRATRPGVKPVIRTGLLEAAIGDYEFVIRNSPPDFVLLPEIWTRIGDNQLLLSRPGDAYDAFARAREIKPDYWPAYSHWADVLIRAGERAQARNLVETGLRYAPDSEALREQFRKLGGDPSRVVPLPSAAASAAENTAAPASAPEAHSQ